MYIRRIYYPLKTLGPGDRVVIYVMGCNKNCKGCMSKELQVRDEKYNISVSEVIKQIKEYYVKDSEIGITISGGEPFLQVELDELINKIREMGIDDILVYSGYTYEELCKMGKQEIINKVSVLIEGEYIEELNDNKPLRGSSNQRIIFIDDKIKEKYSGCLGKKREIEYVVDDETINIYGIFDKEMGLKIKESFENYNIELVEQNNKTF